MRSFALLSLMVVLALLVRIYGIDFGPFHPDEPAVVHNVQRILDEQTLDPGYYRYGSLILYLHAGVLLGLDELRAALGMGALPRGAALEVARGVSAVMGAITVLLAALLARVALGGGERRAGAWIAPAVAAAIVAVSLVSVQCAHYATVDTPMTTFAIAAALLALKAVASGRLWWVVVAAAFCGLAAAIKYTGVLAALPVFAAIFLGARGDRLCVGAGLALVGAFLAAMPYAVLEPGRLWGALKGEFAHYASGAETVFAAGPDSLCWNAEFLYHTGLGPWLCALLVLALAWLGYRLARGGSAPLDRQRIAVLLVYPVALFAFLSCFRVRFDRNLLPLIPFAAVAVGLLVDALHRWIAPRWKPGASALLALVGVFVLHQLCRDVVFDRQLEKDHPEKQMQAWLAAEHPGAKVAEYRFRQDRSLAQLQSEGFDLVVMSSHSLDPVRRHPERFPELALQYDEIMRRCEPLAVFRNGWFEAGYFAPHHLANSATINVYHGPTLTVLRVR